MCGKTHSPAAHRPPDREAAHWGVEAKEDADQEGVRLGGDLVEKWRVG